MLRHTESAADALSDLLADAVLPADETEEEENVGVQAARTGRQGAESSARRMTKQRQKKQIQRQYAAAQTGRQAEGIVVQGAGEAVFTPVQKDGAESRGVHSEKSGKAGHPVPCGDDDVYAQQPVRVYADCAVAA